jgi:hypothetical protein
MDMESKDGSMEHVMREISKMDLNMDMENFYGQMEVNMMVNSDTIISKVLVIINGQIEDNIKEYGATIRCMEKEYSFGLMGENIKDNM